ERIRLLFSGTSFICPGRPRRYNAVNVDEEKKSPAHIIPILCKGCGTCAADCPTDAITMTNFTDAMILRQIDIALRENAQGKVLIFA
ncbi:unnamed protein product, partial [marine sediment metagenome]